MPIKKADLVLKNGFVCTVDKIFSHADSVAVKGDAITFVGSSEDVEAQIGSGTEIVDLEGKMVLPGFVDAHAHPSYAMDLVGNISLYPLDSIGEYQQEITKFVQTHPAKPYFRGSGWADTHFPNLGPSKEILDAIIPDRPISLISYDGHSMWVNTRTLQMAQITKDTPDPEGGRIERDPQTGEPSGTLRETAFKLVEEVIPDYTLEERMNALLAYQDMAARAGITLTHDAMLDPQSIQAFYKLVEEGRLKIRFRGAITMHPDRPLDGQIETIRMARENDIHPFFHINAAKIFVDGVVEGGTAYLFEPYAHKPEYHGEPIWEPELLNTAAAALDGQGIQIHFHVIGDAAARITLDALEQARQTNGKRDSRHLITHLQLVESEDILRFKHLGVIAVPQPFWFKIDDYYHELALPYLGKERAGRQYPMQSFIDTGVVIASASDFPVTIPFDPVIAIQIGMTRASVVEPSDQVLWPQERVGLDEMLKSFTYNGAYANFLENHTGSLEVGKQADLIVLDQNLFEMPPEEIASTQVLLTLVNGQAVYRDLA
jgi:predicted amidohydrolase YtcJ